KEDLRGGYGDKAVDSRQNLTDGTSAIQPDLSDGAGNTVRNLADGTLYKRDLAVGAIDAQTDLSDGSSHNGNRALPGQAPGRVSGRNASKPAAGAVFRLDAVQLMQAAATSMNFGLVIAFF